MFFSMYPKVAYDLNNNGVPKLLTNIATYSSIEANQKLLDDVTFYKNYTIPDGYRPDQVSMDLYGSVDYYWTFFVLNRHLKNYYSDWPKPIQQLKEFTEDKWPHTAGILKRIDTIVTNGNEVSAGLGIIGETVVGRLSKATGILLRKYPTRGYIAIETTSGEFGFNDRGETITGVTSGHSFICQSFVKEAYAPDHHIDSVSGERVSINYDSPSILPVTYFDVEREKNLNSSFIRVIKPEFIQDVAEEFKKSMQE